MVERVISDHFPLQWLTRIKGYSTMDAKVHPKDGVQDEVDTLMEHATYVATTSIGDNPKARYYINRDIVIVVSEDDKVYITTWRIKYKLPDGLDEEFRKGLLTAIKKEQAEYEEEEKEVQMLIDADVMQQQDIRRTITELKKEVRELEKYEGTLGANIQSHKNRLLPKRIEIDRHIKQLLNSKDMWTSFNSEK